MGNIYDLTGEWMQVYDMADDPDMDEESWFSMMEEIEGDLEEKAENYAKIIRMLTARMDAKKAEVKRIRESAEVDAHAIERMKKNLQMMMEATGKTKFKTDLFSFGIQKNPASLVLSEELDINSLSPEWLTFKEPEVNKTAVKEAIKAGKEFEWARLEQTESLRIR